MTNQELIECLRLQAKQQNLIARTAMQTAADRFEQTEAKLAKAVETLETIVDNGGAGSYHLARTTLAELEGEK